MPVATLERSIADALCDEFCALRHETFAPTEFRVKWVTQDWEVREAYALRRAVFCSEQGVFVGDDRDPTDARAQLLVATLCMAGMPVQVVGTVRIHREKQDGLPQLWYGSRLAVNAAFRHHSRLGATLIRLAVSSAHALGCRTFRAHVQRQNVEMFQRMHWRLLGEETLHGRLHGHMEADLSQYPPCHDPRGGFVTLSRARQ